MFGVRRQFSYPTYSVINSCAMLCLVAQLCPTLCNPMDCMYSPWNSPGKNTGVGSLSLLQGIFLTQESNWGLLHCRRILYQLSYQGSHVTRGGDNVADTGCCSYKQTRTLCENLEFSFCPESMGKISEDFVKS